MLLHANLRIDCQADGIPAPTHQWRKSNQRRFSDQTSATSATADWVSIVSGPHVHVLENGSLVVVDAVREDEGEYMCSASSSVGSISSNQVRVRVRTPAHFVHKFLTIKSKVMDRVTLACEAHGDEPMSMTWMHKNQIISNSMPSLNPNSHKYVVQDTVTQDANQQSIRKSSLVLESTMLSDTGAYSCTASNAFGRDEMSVQLVVQSVPEAPIGVRAVQVGSRRIAIDWKSVPSDGNSPIVHFLVHYKKSSGDERR